MPDDKTITTPIKLGFIGAGAMATWQTYPSLHFAPFELVAVCDIDEERAAQVARTFGGTSYTDYRQMLQRESLEAVIVQMHPKPRAAIVEDCLATGHHVLVPKPPAMDTREATHLATLARENDRILMVNVQRRFSFGVTEALKIIRSPEFGPISQILCSFCSGAYDQVRGANYESPVHAYVIDFALHHLDLCRYLCGEFKTLSIQHNQTDGRVAIAGAATFENGAVGSLQLNSQRIWWRNYDRIEITGQGAYVVIDGLWGIKHYRQGENTFTENYSDERSGELTGDAGTLIEFTKAIREAREPVANMADCVNTIRVAEAVYLAVRDGHQGEIDLS